MQLKFTIIFKNLDSRGSTDNQKVGLANGIYKQQANFIRKGSKNLHFKL